MVLLGEDACLLADVIPESVSLSYAEDMMAAIKLAAEHARQGDAVLLSPACASFDMFKDYQDRGRTFKEIVLKLAEEEG